MRSRFVPSEITPTAPATPRARAGEGRCVYRLEQGRAFPAPMHPRLKTLGYSVCVSARQDRKLFGGRRTPPEPLGCGSYGCVYPYAPDPKRWVVKITADESDVAAMRKGQGITQVPRLAAYARLKGSHVWVDQPYGDMQRKPTVYAMLVERLRPVAEELDYQAISCVADLAARRRPGDHADRSQLIEDCRTWHRSKGGYVAWDFDKAAEAVIDFTAAAQRRGLAIHDVHANNIGQDAKGQWKILDMGYNAARPRRVPGLAGARRCW